MPTIRTDRFSWVQSPTSSGNTVRRPRSPTGTWGSPLIRLAGEARPLSASSTTSGTSASSGCPRCAGRASCLGTVLSALSPDADLADERQALLPWPGADPAGKAESVQGDRRLHGARFPPAVRRLRIGLGCRESVREDLRLLVRSRPAPLLPLRQDARRQRDLQLPGQGEVSGKRAFLGTAAGRLPFHLCPAAGE